MIKIKNVTYKYDNNTVLDDISLEIKKGESVAIIGANGSGKTTLLKLINGLVDYKIGEYYFDGQKIDKKYLDNPTNRKIFHKRVGFVFQDSDNQLFCTTVYEEVEFGLLQLKMDKKHIEGRVTDCLNLLDIYHLKDRVPYTLSGGEKKKVALAAILALNPDVLTLDEPLNEIDPRSKRKLKELLKTLNSYGKTIICATHDFEYFDGVFTRAIVISENHKIVYDGEFDYLMRDRELLQKHNII